MNSSMEKLTTQLALLKANYDLLEQRVSRLEKNERKDDDIRTDYERRMQSDLDERRIQFKYEELERAKWGIYG